ncbi:hypothetical protein [Microbacterium sp.]|uniref:hypothetical protein n=1 Tax=Microbacterium sp. TaxID=51671 RepID=UPI003736E648
MMHRAAAPVLATLVAFTLAGCISTDMVGPDPSHTRPQETPTVQEPAEATNPAAPPHIAAAYEVPPASDDEIARIVYVSDGPDGSPVTETTIAGLARTGALYQIRYDCRPAVTGATLEFTWAAASESGTTDPTGALLVECEGPAMSEGLTLADATDAAYQFAVTSTDTIDRFWAQVVPMP